jgi:hypothetical protein
MSDEGESLVTTSRDGDVVRITSFVHYDLNGAGRFSAIRVGSYG